MLQEEKNRKSNPRSTYSHKKEELELEELH